MELGLSVHRGASYENQVKFFKKYGISHTFIMSNHPDFHSLMVLFRENGITCDNLHAPFKGINAMWGENEAAAQNMFSQLVDSVDKCAQYGIPVTVVHLSSGRPMPEINELGVARFAKLFDYAAQKGVTVALENQRYKENLACFMERFQTPGFCWDCGHEYGVTGEVGFMKLYGHRLAALHIHDNRCGVGTDDHLLPFDGKIDFDRVAEQIAQSGYRGTLMLEVLQNANITDKPFYGDLTDEQYIARAVAAARRLSDMIENYKEAQ